MLHPLSSSLFQNLKSEFPHLSIAGPADLENRAPGEHPENLRCGVMAMPESTEEAATLVGYAARHHIPVVSQGGRTGLVGGGTSKPGDLIISTARLNRIEAIHAEERIAVVEAGVTLETLQKAVQPLGLTPRIDLASRGSATIGGMTSTNAGGILAFRNGVMRHQVLGLEAVLPDGSVFSDMSRVLKVSAGPDLKHLLIGGEGAFGLVTRIVLKLETRNNERATALIGLPSASSALALVGALEASHAIQLEGAELMWEGFFRDSALAHGFDVAWLDPHTPTILLVEISGETADIARDALESTLAAHWEQVGVTCGLVAQSLAQAARFWQLREQADFIYREHKGAPSFDVSLPPGSLDVYVENFRQRLNTVSPTLGAYVYGHMADGNLHISITHAGEVSGEALLEMEAAVYGGVQSLGGSFSAEHGIGSDKRHAFMTYGDPVKRHLAQSLKRAVDPQLLFNPGKVPFVTG